MFYIFFFCWSTLIKCSHHHEIKSCQGNGGENRGEIVVKVKELRRHRLRVVSGRKEEEAESTYTILIK